MKATATVLIAILATVALGWLRPWVREDLRQAERSSAEVRQSQDYLKTHPRYISPAEAFYFAVADSIHESNADFAAKVITKRAYLNKLAGWSRLTDGPISVSAARTGFRAFDLPTARSDQRAALIPRHRVSPDSAYSKEKWAQIDAYLASSSADLPKIAAEYFLIFPPPTRRDYDRVMSRTKHLSQPPGFWDYVRSCIKPPKGA